jgi:hypothetical protein
MKVLTRVDALILGSDEQAGCATRVAAQAVRRVHRDEFDVMDRAAEVATGIRTGYCCCRRVQQLQERQPRVLARISRCTKTANVQMITVVMGR